MGLGGGCKEWVKWCKGTEKSKICTRNLRAVVLAMVGTGESRSRSCARNNTEEYSACSPSHGFSLKEKKLRYPKSPVVNCSFCVVLLLSFSPQPPPKYPQPRPDGTAQ